MENDIELLNSAREWNKDALEKIFELYPSALYHSALRLGRDPMMADQIVGDVFVKLLEHLSSGKGPKTNLRSYLYQTMYHLIIDNGRSARRKAPLEVADLFCDDLRSAWARLEDRVMFDVILNVIWKDLTKDQRHVIILLFLEDFSLNETAGILCKEVGHIKVIQGRAIAKLRKGLGYSGPESIA